MMKKISIFIILPSLILFSFTNLIASNNIKDMKENPDRYIQVHDWGFYAVARVAILHHLTLKNESSLTYRDVKIRVNYYSTNPTNYGNKISQQEAVLKIIVPPKSKKTYLESGLPIGAGSHHMMAKNLEIISATASEN